MVVQPHVIPARKITIYSPITINLVEGCDSPTVGQQC